LVRELSCQGDNGLKLKAIKASAKAEVLLFEQDASSLLESGRRKMQKSPKGCADFV
jgi:hypothetical protein